MRLEVTEVTWDDEVQLLKKDAPLYVILLSCCVYFWTFLHPAVEYGHGRLIYGFQAFAFIQHPTWLANPLYWYAVFALALRRPRMSAIFAGIAFFFSLTVSVHFFYWEETGRLVFRIGYFLWCSSFAIHMLGSLLVLWVTPRPSC